MEAMKTIWTWKREGETKIRLGQTYLEAIIAFGKPWKKSLLLLSSHFLGARRRRPTERQRRREEPLAADPRRPP